MTFILQCPSKRSTHLSDADSPTRDDSVLVEADSCIPEGTDYCFAQFARIVSDRQSGDWPTVGSGVTTSEEKDEAPVRSQQFPLGLNQYDTIYFVRQHTAFVNDSDGFQRTCLCFLDLTRRCRA